MSRYKSWTDQQLEAAVANCFSVRAVIKALGLVPAGGNYVQITKRISDLKLSTDHFRGKGWNVGWIFDPRKPIAPIQDLLIKNGHTQSHQLKRRLFTVGLKKPACELCGWNERSLDGRVPVELDHINGDHFDNRIENLRILCPNCHSLQLTHRGRNKKVRYARVL